MEYLDPAAVEVGRNLAELLPSLWLMAGATGPIPEYGGEDYIIPPGSNLAILVREEAFRTFRIALEKSPDVNWVFVVSDSDDGFQQMAEALPERIPIRQRVRLYRDYLTNFQINLDDK
jgi:hypothetical protein